MVFTVFKPNDPDKVTSVELESGVDHRRGADYRASQPLANAVNVGIALGRPILVSGEPGCGKTELGFAIARKLGIQRLHLYPVKSDSDARSLFYEYDIIGRFQAAQIGHLDRSDRTQPPTADASQFVEYRALGRAILDAYPADRVRHLVAGRYRHPGQPQRSVVVIDEIDKAPRDFPNDLLHEIDQYKFRVPELGDSPFGPPETPQEPIPVETRPVVVITSNSERQLPDAFLRRCAYHHISFPDDDTLKAIIDSHLLVLGAKVAEDDVRRAFLLMRKARQSAFEKRPGTAELIDFVHVAGRRREEFPRESWIERFEACAPAMVKTEHDAGIFAQLIAAGFA